MEVENICLIFATAIGSDCAGSLKYYLFYSYYLPALYGTKCRINVTRLYMARNAVYLCK